MSTKKPRRQKITMSLPQYAGAIIPGIKETAISAPAVIKQIGVTFAKKAGQKMRAKGLPDGVSADKYGRFYTITVLVEKGTEIRYS